MSLAGVINSHTMAALIVLHHGTEEQRGRWLPRFAAGEARGGLCLTEPHAGSDVQAILTRARRVGEEYRISGTKMFVTNGREGNTFGLLAVTDTGGQPRHRGMSCFIVEKGGAGLTVVKSIGKLGYKGVDTAELLFEDFACPAANLVGGVEGRGFGQVMSGLEAGRINIAARAVGVAQAAFEEAAARGAGAPRLDDMAARVDAARLLADWAAGVKERAEGRVPDEIVAELADLGVFAALVPPAHGGLGLDPATWTMVIEEVARVWAAPALLAVAQGGVAFALGSAGGDTARHLPALGRAETLAAVVPIPAALARRDGAACVLDGETAPIAPPAPPRLLALTLADGAAWWLVPASLAGVTVAAAAPDLGLRGRPPAVVSLRGVPLSGRRPPSSAPRPLPVVDPRLRAVALGLRHAAFEAAPRRP